MDVKEALVTTLRVIIKKIIITKLQLFHEIHGTLLIQIYDRDQPNHGMRKKLRQIMLSNNTITFFNIAVIMFHEELKETVALCIKDIIHRCSTDIIELLYTRDNMQKLGEGILLCLIIARTEKSSVVR